MALMAAVARNDARSVARLIRSGADPQSREDPVLRIGMTTIVSALQLRWTPPFDDETVLHVAIMAQFWNNCMRDWRDVSVDLTIPGTLVDAGADVNAQTRSGMTPLHWAAVVRSHEAVEFLLKRGADVNLADANGVTPLLTACMVSAGPLAVGALLVAGAAPNVSTCMGMTPLMFAAGRGENACASRLLAFGADPSPRNYRGQTALDQALERGHKQCVAILTRALGLPARRRRSHRSNKRRPRARR